MAAEAEERNVLYVKTISAIKITAAGRGGSDNPRMNPLRARVR